MKNARFFHVKISNYLYNILSFMMDDYYFRQILGVKTKAPKTEIKRAFHRLARKNHPDLYTDDQKEIQELKMMALNEAYTWLMRYSEEESGQETDQPNSAESTAAAVEKPHMPGTHVGFHRDPSYAYYKQGFVNFSRAIHGMEALYKSMAEKRSFKPHHESYQRFSNSLVLLRRAHEYFSRVVDEYPDSMWKKDARIKLRRIERFSKLYRKIVSNYKEAC